ncbi:MULTISPECIES: hypothetical protein [Planktothricoides]|uniref:Transposase n=1 Tax=Planktothricoides raciborskii GIHE-MW2 TaxID=2792601 RepID=A0AAU8JFA1_9CYAN|nr:hypothetical protein [Planktothricoides sp. SR001]
MVSSTQSQKKPNKSILPKVSTELFSLVLADLAREFDLNKNKRILLVLDQARSHTTEKLILPEVIDLFFLPSPKS